MEAAELFLQGMQQRDAADDIVDGKLCTAYREHMFEVKIEFHATHCFA
jgi:hypothetical protein